LLPLAEIEGAGLPILLLIEHAFAPNVQPANVEPSLENKLAAPVVALTVEDAAEIPL
jgi:hypothetical protein